MKKKWIAMAPGFGLINVCVEGGEEAREEVTKVLALAGRWGIYDDWVRAGRTVFEEGGGQGEDNLGGIG